MPAPVTAVVVMGGEGGVTSPLQLQNNRLTSRHGPGNLTGNLQAGKGNLEKLRKIDAELQVERQNPVKMVKKYHFRVVWT